MSHLFAIHTYGSERVRDANSGETVSAYKLGYYGTESAVLVALYGQRARKVAVSRASYHYVALDKDAPKAVHGGYFLFDLTDDELARAEAVTRRFPHDSSVSCYRWMNGAWHDLPTAKRDYKPIAHLYLAISRIKPGDHRAARLDESDSASANTDRLILTREGDWYWISGDTYPHRELLKRWGCRWGKKRQAWYYIGMTLPSAIQDLIDRLTVPVAPPIALSDPIPTNAEAILPPEPPFKPNDRVRHTTFDTGIGKIIKLRNDKGNPSSDGDWLYEVQFPDDDAHLYYASALTPVDPSGPDAKMFDHHRPFYQLGATVYLTRSIYTQLEKPSIVGGTAVTLIARHDLRQWEGERKTDWGYQVRLADGQTHYVFDYQVSHRQSNDAVHKLPELDVHKYGSSDALRREIVNRIAHRNRIGEQPNFDEPKPSATATPTEAPAKSTSSQPQFTLGQRVYLIRNLYRSGKKGDLWPAGGAAVVGDCHNIETYTEFLDRYGYRIQINGESVYVPESFLANQAPLNNGVSGSEPVRLIPGLSAEAMLLENIERRNHIGQYPMVYPSEVTTALTETDTRVAPLLAGSFVYLTVEKRNPDDQRRPFPIGTHGMLRHENGYDPPRGRRYEVRINDGGTLIDVWEDEFREYDPDIPRFKVGDPVMRIHRHDLGIGTIQTLASRRKGDDHQYYQVKYRTNGTVRERDIDLVDAKLIPVAVADTPKKPNSLQEWLNITLQSADQAKQVEQAILKTQKHGWQGDLMKEREIQAAIFAVVKDEYLTETLFKRYCDYAMTSPTHDPHTPIVAQQADAMSSLLAMAGMSEADEVTPVIVEPPKIIITQPNLNPDDPVVQAIERVGTMTLKPYQAPKVQVSGIRIPQQPCGELTGSISGGIHCYGWAVHAGVCLYLNFGGPRTGVEAIRAKLSKGQIVSCIPDEAEAIELTAGEGNTGKYTPYFALMPEVKFTHLILIHEKVLNPNTSGEGIAPYAFVIEASPEQAQAQVWQHVRELVKITVFVQWIPYLWEAGIQAHLIQLTRSAGGITIWAIQMNRVAWTQVITAGLANRLIGLTLNPV